MAIVGALHCGVNPTPELCRSRKGHGSLFSVLHCS